MRVPFLVAGPGIPAGKESDVVVNGLDFYPTILSMAGVKKPEGKNLDGADLKPLLTGAVEDSSLVLDQNGKPRTDMVWHYPNMRKNQSTIRAGDFKLIRNYETDSGKPPALELYHLVDTKDGKSARVDIEEAKNIAAKQPKKAAELNARLTEILTEMKASLPYWNPTCLFRVTNKEKVPAVTGHTVDGQTIIATFQENGARVVRADAIYTTKNSGGEWLRMIGEVDNGTAKLALPPAATGLRSGQFGRVTIPVSEGRQLSVPSSAIVRRGQLDALFVVQDGIAHLRGRPRAQLGLAAIAVGHVARVMVMVMTIMAETRLSNRSDNSSD